MQLKTTMWYHLKPITMSIIKKKSFCKDVEQLEP